MYHEIEASSLRLFRLRNVIYLWINSEPRSSAREVTGYGLHDRRSFPSRGGRPHFTTTPSLLFSGYQNCILGDKAPTV